MRGSLGLTEPNAGSDLQAIRTVARLDGDHYVVNGTKTWITNSLHGHLTLLLVKTDPDAEPRHKGMSMLIAEKGPGFNVVGKLKKMGYRAIDTCELSFDDYRVPKRRTCSAASRARASCRRRAASSWAASTSPSRGAGIAEGCARRWRCATRRSAAHSASRSGSTRRSS